MQLKPTLQMPTLLFLGVAQHHITVANQQQFLRHQEKPAHFNMDVLLLL